MKTAIFLLMLLGYEASAELPEALMVPADYGFCHRPITTDKPKAQAYFDQGLAFIYDYSYRSARRSFEEAIRVDPQCAMAHWGIALSYGNTINSPEIGEEDSAAALKALGNTGQTGHMTRLERGLIEAQRVRFAVPAPTLRQDLNRAYADAMRVLWQQYPKDPMVGILFADALIDCHPWDQWTHEGQPKEGTVELMKTVKAVLRLDPKNLHALHLYIHAYEASPFPEKASFAADRLENLAPGLSHLQHMPCHIYTHTGDWDKAVEANLNCLRSGDAYLQSRNMIQRRGVLFDHYEIALIYAACMRGQSALARTTARQMFANATPEEAVAEYPEMDGEGAMPLEVMKRFGEWDTLLTVPDYGPKCPVSNAIRAGDRAIAWAAQGRLENAERERQEFERLYLTIPETLKLGLDNARQLLSVEHHLVAGELLIRTPSTEAQGLMELTRAVEVQDNLLYSEPPQWIIPARHSLGAALLRAGQYEKAVAVYQEDLRRNPRNGWALAGLARAYRALGKTSRARKTEQAFRTAWKDADISISTSCLCLP